MSRYQRYLYVCINQRPDGAPRPSCGRSAPALYQRLKDLIAQSGMRSRHEVRACSCSCQDACEAGPVIFVHPDGYAYGRVSEGDLAEIVEALGRGQRIERLVLEDRDFALTP